MARKYSALDVSANIQFNKSYELLNECFGTDYNGWMKATWIPKGNKFYVWMPKLAKKRNGKLVPATNQCLNILSDDWNTIIFDDLMLDRYKDGIPDFVENKHQRPIIVFAKEPDNGPYIFRGVYVFDKERSKYLHSVHKRISTKVEIIGDIATDIHIPIDSELQKLIINEDEFIKTTNSNIESKQFIEPQNISKKPVEPVLINGINKFPRHPMIASYAIMKSGFVCEYNPKHESFTRLSNGTKYTEPHHLIPISRQSSFNVSLDIPENIVSLCSNCHNCIHYGKEGIILLKNLYLQRKDALKKVGIEIDFDTLAKMYYK